MNPGESVWEPMIRKPESGDASSGTHHAITAPPRTMTCPPGVASHGAVSSCGTKPASMSRSATTRAAWKELGLAAMKSIRSSVWFMSPACHG